MAFYVLQEDGTSEILLEDGTGGILTEAQPAQVTPPFIGSATVLHAPQLAYTGTQVAVTTAGTHLWVAPAGVTYIYVECFGGGGGGGNFAFFTGGGGGGGGAFARRTAVPVTPGTVYTFVVGAGGSGAADGTDSSFTGDSGIQVIAAGGKKGVTSTGSPVTGGAGGQASDSTGDVTFSGGDGGDGVAFDGGGGGASGNRVADGAAGAGGETGVPNSHGGLGGTGSTGGGSGGAGGDNGNASDGGSAGSSPGGGGGGSAHGTGYAGADGEVVITIDVATSFIGSVTVVYSPTVSSAIFIHPPFIGSATVVYDAAIARVDPPFISSTTRVFGVFSLFDPNRTYSGPGNGGETFMVRLAANGTTVTATLAADIGAGDTALELTGDGSLPSADPFVVTIDSEVIYIVQIAPGSYRIRARAVSNTAAAAHTAGATVSWGDSYDLALVASSDIAHDFTADINSTGSQTYPGWLVCFDSSQGYLAGDRYPMHVDQVLGVFDAGAGSTGTSRLDGAQPNVICTPTGVSDDCPAALSKPALVSSDIAVGDVAVVRYTNPEATPLDLGPRSVSLQSWFGLKRVSTSDADVTFTDPNGIVVDTTGTYDTFTGSINGEWFEPSAIGIGPETGEPTPNACPYTTVTLPGSDRFFTDGIHYNEKGWPFGVLAVRQGNRRVPLWQSYDWHNFSYVYNGFGVDDTFTQIVVNRNGVTGTEPEVVLPGSQDITGPDAVWDDGTYYFAVAWYVAIFSGPYLVIGPTIGGVGPGSSDFPTPSYIPSVTFPGGTATVVTPTPPPVEGGSGGDIAPPALGQLFQAAAV